MKKVLFIVFHLTVFAILSCSTDELNVKDAPNCPPYDIVPSSPYEDPIWHPSGTLIGFNHTPIKEIRYINGYHCPHQATYIYEVDSTGFWAVDSDGKNKRRLLPFKLHAPDWSPDGKWVAFENGGQIFKIPFNGEEFDTSSIAQLTFSGRNFFPAWSPDGRFIAYDNTNCGSATTPIPPYSCGVLVMDEEGGDKEFLGTGRMPYWDGTADFVYSYGSKYSLHSLTKVSFFDPVQNHIAIQQPPRFNPSATVIAFIGNYTNSVTQFPRLFAITPDGKTFKKISDKYVMNFSWAPDGKIAYLNYDYSRIDNEKGTIWTMDQEGKNHKQVTYNIFLITN